MSVKSIKSIIGYYAVKNFLKLRWYKHCAKKHISMMPFVYDEVETLQLVADKKYSVARYGDGEIGICKGEGIYFQEFDSQLAQRLKDILRGNSIKNLLVCIAPHTTSCYQLTSKVNTFVYKFISRRGESYTKLLDPNKKYGSTFISRPDAFEFKNSEFQHYTKLLQSLWNGRDVIIVTGKDSRFEMLPELFDNIRSHKFVYGLKQHAFRDYEKLLEEIKLDAKEKLILLALGPTATILAHDLAIAGYQAIDIGHLPNCYKVVKNGVRPTKMGICGAPTPETSNGDN